MGHADGGIGRLLAKLNRCGNRYLARRLEPLGIGRGEYEFLLELLKTDDVSQEHLSRVLGVDPGVTARALRKLEDRGLVARRRSDKDRRLNRVRLTEDARRMESGLLGAQKSWTEALAGDFSREGRERIAMLLDQMADNAARAADHYDV